jgi:hypothetical protein
MPINPAPTFQIQIFLFVGAGILTKTLQFRPHPFWSKVKCCLPETENTPKNVAICTAQK